MFKVKKRFIVNHKINSIQKNLFFSTISRVSLFFFGYIQKKNNILPWTNRIYEYDFKYKILV